MIDRQRIESFPQRITLGCTPFVGTLSWVSDEKPHVKRPRANHMVTPPIGEFNNEDKIILDGEEPASMLFKGHCAEKNGIFACLLAAEAIATGETSLSGRPAALSQSVGRLSAGSISAMPEMAV
jgi:hypothetical protein